MAHDLVTDVLESMDTSWDKKAMKVPLYTTRTREETKKLIISSRINQYTDYLLSDIQRKKEVLKIRSGKRSIQENEQPA